MQAKEHGLGYRVEWEDVLYLAPTPLVLIDSENRFHSITEPAMRWKDGQEFYYIHGVNFKKEEWEKVVSGELNFKEIMKFENMEQRMAALKLYDKEKLLNDAKAKLIHIGEEKDVWLDGKILDCTNHLYQIDEIFPQTEYFLKYACPSTGRIYISCIDPDFAQKSKNADECMGWKFGLTKDEYGKLAVET